MPEEQRNSVFVWTSAFTLYPENVFLPANGRHGNSPTAYLIKEKNEHFFL